MPDSQDLEVFFFVLNQIVSDPCYVSDHLITEPNTFFPNREKLSMLYNKTCLVGT